MVRPPRNPWPRTGSKARGKRGDNVVQFRKKRSRWTRPEAYGHKPARFRQRSAFGSRPLTWGQAWFDMRPWIFLIALVTLSVVWQTPAFYEPPGWLQSDPVRVEGDFTRCGPAKGGWGRGAMCVIDGDTFKIGETKYRVTGIDTAEVHARCPAEAAQAEASTSALQGWLSKGAFQITTRLDEPTDRYGRTLAIVKRTKADGSEERLADWMQTHGGARGYDGGLGVGGVELLPSRLREGPGVGKCAQMPLPEWKPRDTARARELRHQATPAERELWRYLSRSQLGAKFSRQMPVGPFFADFLCRELRLVVELDGFSHDIASEQDRLRDLWMQREGYTVLRFANADVFANVDGVVTSIGEAMMRLRASE